METHNKAAIRIVLMLGMLVSDVALGAWALTDGAQVHPPYQGAVPAKSEVIFSTRFKRDEAPRVAKEFGATRIEWGYSTDPAFVAALEQVTPWYGGSLNANGPLPNLDGMARNFDGEVLVAPWMKAWGGQWVTTTHPDTRKALMDQANAFVALGARSIQQDDAALELHGAMFHGGDFNPATLEGFGRYLAKAPDRALLRSLGLDKIQGTYRDYLIARHGVKDASDYLRRFRSFPSTPIWLRYIRGEVEAYYVDLRETLSKAGGRPIALSANLTTFNEPNEGDRQYFLTRYIDYAMSETHIDDLRTITAQATTLRALGVGSVPSLMPRTVPENRAAIATFYALGEMPVVPWDVYSGNDGAGRAKRYFGKPEEYGDLYTFVRARADLLDGYEATAVVGIAVPVDKYRSEATKELLDVLIQRQIPFAFVALGGVEYELKGDPDRIRRFKAIVSVNPDSDFPAAQLAMLKSTGIQRFQRTDLTDQLLSGLQPFIVAPGAESVRLYPRALPSRKDRLVIHVVDRSRTVAGADASCTRRLGIRKSLLGVSRVSAAQWMSGVASKVIQVDESAQEFLFSINDCPLWGALQLELVP